MRKNNVISLEAYDNFHDPLTELAREGARPLPGTQWHSLKEKGAFT